MKDINMDIHNTASERRLDAGLMLCYSLQQWSLGLLYVTDTYKGRSGRKYCRHQDAPAVSGTRG
jgi:hypothetical protein